MQDSVTKFFTVKYSFINTVIIIMMIFMFYSGNAFAGNATLSWNPSTDSNLAGYTIHYGTSSGSYGTSVNVGNQTTYTVTGLSNGTYYFAVTAYDTFGNQSAYSNEASKTFTGIQAADSSGSSGSMSGGCGMIRNIDNGGNPPRWPMDFILLTAVMAWFGLYRRIKRSMCRLNNGANGVDIRGNGGLFFKGLGGLNS